MRSQDRALHYSASRGKNWATTTKPRGRTAVNDACTVYILTIKGKSHTLYTRQGNVTLRECATQTNRTVQDNQQKLTAIQSFLTCYVTGSSRRWIYTAAAADATDAACKLLSALSISWVLSARFDRLIPCCCQVVGCVRASCCIVTACELSFRDSKLFDLHCRELLEVCFHARIYAHAQSSSTKRRTIRVASVTWSMDERDRPIQCDADTELHPLQNCLMTINNHCADGGRWDI